MSDWLLRWGAVILFSVLVSTSFVMYGFTFNRIGAPPLNTTLQELGIYVIRVLLDPYFIAGMLLALSGALVRMVIFTQVGIAETALISELTLVMSVILSLLIFDSDLSQADIVGMLCIIVGVYFIQSGGST